MASNSTTLRLIAIFKLVKAASLIAVGIAGLKLLHSDVADALADWIQRVGINPGNHYVQQALEKAADVSPHKMLIVSPGSFLYAALFLTEGIGLWLQKRWAEWFTVIITSSLVPLEIYELVRHPTPVKVAILLINIAVVIYLLFRIRSERKKETHTSK